MLHSVPSSRMEPDHWCSASSARKVWTDAARRNATAAQGMPELAVPASPSATSTTDGVIAYCPSPSPAQHHRKHRSVSMRRMGSDPRRVMTTCAGQLARRRSCSQSLTETRDEADIKTEAALAHDEGTRA